MIVYGAVLGEMDVSVIFNLVVLGHAEMNRGEGFVMLWDEKQVKVLFECKGGVKFFLKILKIFSGRFVRVDFSPHFYNANASKYSGNSEKMFNSHLHLQTIAY
jgi:hypothetical protein